VGAGVGDLDHLEAVDGDAFDVRGIASVKAGEQLRAQSRTVPISAEGFLAVEEQVAA